MAAVTRTITRTIETNEISNVDFYVGGMAGTGKLLYWRVEAFVGGSLSDGIAENNDLLRVELYSERKDGVIPEFGQKGFVASLVFGFVTAFNNAMGAESYAQIENTKDRAWTVARAPSVPKLSKLRIRLVGENIIAAHTLYVRAEMVFRVDALSELEEVQALIGPTTL